MTVLRNTGGSPRIILTETGDYIRLAPGCVSANIQVDLDNPVLLAWMAAGDIAEVKPKPSKTLTLGPDKKGQKPSHKR